MNSAPSFEQMFELTVKDLVAGKIRSLKRQGTTGMGIDNLWQVTVSAISKSPFAPVGTNAAYFARQSFDKVVNTHFKSFLI